MKRSAITLAFICLFASTVVPSDARQPSTTLEPTIERIAARARGTVGVSVLHLESGRRLSVNGGVRFPMASVFKLPIAVALMDLVDRGALRLDERVEVRPSDLRFGYAAAEKLFSGRSASRTLDELMELMLVQSDNTACDLLLRAVGGPRAVTEKMRALGIDGIDVSRSELELAADWSGLATLPPAEELTLERLERAFDAIPSSRREAAHAAFARDPRDTATPDAIVQLLVKLHRGEALSPESTRHLWEVMTRVETGPNRLRGLLPKGTVVGHKTGTMPIATNDVGIVVLPGGTGHVAIAVFVKEGTADLKTEERVIAEIARAVFDEFDR